MEKENSKKRIDLAWRKFDNLVDMLELGPEEDRFRVGVVTILSFLLDDHLERKQLETTLKDVMERLAMEVATTGQVQN